jgi:hypothetical protein
MSCLVLFAFVILTLPLRGVTQPPIGLDAVEQFANLPIYQQGVISQQLSSSDQMGGNADGEGYLYQEDSLFVVFDREGPGCIYRLWVSSTPTSATRRVLFFFDGETDPSINGIVQQLFSGLFNPFLFPLTGPSSISSGGYYSYFPLPYADHLKVAFVDDSEPHQIGYDTYETGTPVTTYTGLEDPTAVITQWQNIGTDPKDPTGNITVNDSLTLGLGATETIFSSVGEGQITGIRIRINPAMTSTLGSLKLQFYWDSSTVPQVESSFGSFFGNSLAPSNVDGMPIGVSAGEYYCFFPMPFWQNARLDLYNSSPNHSIDVNYTITYKTDPYPSESGYFAAVQREFMQAVAGQDMTIGEFAGCGNFVGMITTLNARDWPNFLTGDLRIYTDGRAYPIAQGTDFDGDFNAGDYLASGTFSLPVHGVPAILTGFENKVNAYRFFLGDVIPFGNSVQIYAEHGNRNSESIEYSAVTFAYLRPEIALALTDQFDVGDLGEEAAHAYTINGSQFYTLHNYAYPGQLDEEFFYDDGRMILGSSSFSVAIDPQNEGVRLVRRKDSSIHPQAAEVLVDAVSVGTWWDGDFNFYKRWGESAFEIPAAYTQGLSQITVEVNPGGLYDWNEYYYWIYSHIPPQPDITPPGLVMNVEAQTLEAGTKLLLQWDPGGDDLGVARYRIYRDTTTGVQASSEFLAGESVLIRYTDESLNPGTYYYYRISAMDYSGNEGEASSEVLQRTSNNYYYEGEDISRFLGTSGDAYTAENMMPYGEDWSGQYQLLYYSNNVGDYFIIPIEVAETDIYDVFGYFTKGSSYGNLKLYIDNLLHGDIVYLYAPSTIRSPIAEFGSVSLEAGEHEFKFEVAGRDTASDDFWLGLDNLLLTAHSLMPVAPTEPQGTPQAFALKQNYPNPFNATTRISLSLPKAGVTVLTVFDVQGRRIAVLKDEWMAAGQHALDWKPSNLSSGLYFVRLKQDGRTSLRKVLFLK